MLGLFVAAVAGGTAFVVTSNADPTYRATAARIAAEPSASLLSLDVVAPPQVDPSVYRSALIEGYLVRDELTRVDGAMPSQRELESFLRNVRVSVDSRLTSSVIRIDVDHTDPSYAARVANGVSAEPIVEDAASDAHEGQTFVSVRFGNVLGSRGSALQVFKDQIRAVGPVTVTRPCCVTS